MPKLIPLSQAREIVLSHSSLLETEIVSLIDAAGRVAAQDLQADIDSSPFAAAGMDGFAVHAADIENASEDAPVILKVINEIAAGDYYEGDMPSGTCIRIMTGACVPPCADTVVKYEIVTNVEGDGKCGSLVSFSAPAKLGANVREPGEEAKAGETIVHAGDVINSGGVGFLASCGITEVLTYRRPHVAIMATGSELVDAHEVPTNGKIRNSNAPALAACVVEAGCIPHVLPIVADKYELILQAVKDAAKEYDYVLTTGGACQGDFDFITQVIEELGESFITAVNMKPGKAETFGIVEGTPVFGLPGNPAAAYIGFQMLVRPSLRKMQGYSHLERIKLKAKLSRDIKASRDPRMTLMRAIMTKNSERELEVAPLGKQSSGLFGPLQQSNCLIIVPQGDIAHAKGEIIETIVLDIPEEVVL
jgi:molybdopterin molybdotransferase